MAANFDAFEVFPDIVGAVASRPGIFSWRVFFIDDRGGGDGGGGPAEWRIHRASRQILARRKRAGGRGRRETYPRRGNTILKLVRAEQISGPEISLVTRYMYTHKGRKQREREREEDKVIRASTCKMEGWKEGRGEKKRRAKRREEGERWRQSIRRVFSMRLERNYFISGR